MGYTEEFGLFSTYTDHFPGISSFFVNHTEEQEDEETLKWVKHGKKNLESLSKSRNRESEDGKEPGDSKEEHDSTNTDHQLYYSFTVSSFIISSSLAPSMSSHHYNDPDEDDNIE